MTDEIKIIAKWHKYSDNTGETKPREWAERMVNEFRAVWVDSNTISIALKRKDFMKHIKQRDNYTCVFCGYRGTTIDHLIPKSKGGLMTPLNTVCSCRVCNKNKGSKSLEEFLSAEDYTRVLNYMKNIKKQYQTGVLKAE
jgi:hypothetical protein